LLYQSNDMQVTEDLLFDNIHSFIRGTALVIKKTGHFLVLWSNFYRAMHVVVSAVSLS